MTRKSYYHKNGMASRASLTALCEKIVVYVK